VAVSAILILNPARSFTKLSKIKRKAGIRETREFIADKVDVPLECPAVTRSVDEVEIDCEELRPIYNNNDAAQLYTRLQVITHKDSRCRS